MGGGKRIGAIGHCRGTRGLGGGGREGFQHMERGEERRVGLSEKSCMRKYKMKGLALQHVVTCRYFLPNGQKTPGGSILFSSSFFIRRDIFHTDRFFI